ncbi:MAG: heterodisulfide reductase-related iron-sulfur binding cluster [Longimicrobiales bacterium]|nr:heterodisulfide reductase-related iron-sulfur binding cluster [Longimicrobiales bacterium]
MTHLLRELKKQEEKLFNCVHCGFCLPVCPTYSRLGDEADSPRGRLHFMRAVVEGRIQPESPALNRHLDRCLGCRACESVCPSGVEYGRLLEGAREVTRAAVPPSTLSRLLPRVMASPWLLPPLMLLTRALRGTGLPGVAARRLPGEGLLGQARLGMGMIAATASPRVLTLGRKGVLGPGREEGAAAELLGGNARTGMLRGCVQDGLLGRVNRATARVLEANGFKVVEVPRQGCCGAIHSHTGELDGARELARKNIRVFEAMDLDFIAVNAAGCGASMKEYPHLLAEDPQYGERAQALASRVRDVSELLGKAGLLQGGPIPLKVTYDAPCHLLHAQRISREPLGLLDSIPGLELAPLKGHDECCGGAGIYGITHPELGGRISRDKVQAILDTGAQVVATGNPGCMMQIGAGLHATGARVDVVHPVELLDESYRRGGLYL